MKRFYLKQIAKGKSPQDAEVAAASKARMYRLENPHIEREVRRRGQVT